jgi:hypothetical protein
MRRETKLRAGRPLAFALFALGCVGVWAQDDDAVLDEESITTIDIDEMPPTAEKACLYVRRARSFDPIDNRHLHVEASGDEHFLLTLQPGCIGLRSAFGIAISNQSNRVCSNDLATVTYRQFDRRETCRVLEVEMVASKEAAEAVVAARTKRN